MATDIKIGSYACTYGIIGAHRYTAICKVIQILTDSAPSRDSTDYLAEVQIGTRRYVRRLSELRPLTGRLLKARGD